MSGRRGPLCRVSRVSRGRYAAPSPSPPAGTRGPRPDPWGPRPDTWGPRTGDRSVPARAPRDRLAPGRSGAWDRRAPGPSEGSDRRGRSAAWLSSRARAGRAEVPSQDRGPELAGPRGSPPAGRDRVGRSELAFLSAEPSRVRGGPSPRKLRVPRPAVALARGRRISAPAAGAVLLVPPVVGRVVVRRAPSAADGRAVRCSPWADCERVVRRAPSLAGGRDVRRVSPSPRAAVSARARSGEDARVVRRGPSPPGVRGARRWPSPLGVRGPRRWPSPPDVRGARVPSPVALSRPAPARPVRGCCPAEPDAGRPRPRLVDPLVPADFGLADFGLADLGLLPGIPAPFPEVARGAFGVPLPVRPPLLRALPPAPRSLGVPRPSATATNLQHLPPQYPDKRRGPLDHIGSDPLQACPAASYSPTRSPAQYHRR